MRSYEAACIFYADEARYRTGKEAVASALNELEVQDLKEHDMGVRSPSYPINKELQVHYLVFQFQATPENANKIEDKVRYLQDLLRIMVTRQDD